MAVTQGLGDGFALYNGVKLPNIDSVWTEEVKETHPWAATVSMSGRHLLCFTVAPMAVDSGYYVQTAAGNYTEYLYDSTTDSWVFNKSAEVEAGYRHSPTSLVTLGWCTGGDVIDLSDDSIHLAATTPIPLDGMQVIEWDGDTTGLENLYEMQYKVSDTILRKDDFTNCVVVMTYTDRIAVGQGVEGLESEGIAMSEVDGVMSIYSEDNQYGISTGLWFGKTDGVAYTSLFAYTAAVEEQPKWQFNLRDFLSGAASAAASRGVLRRTPIAYLYNGVQLPPLPEVEGYMVIGNNYSSTLLRVSDSPSYYDNSMVSTPTPVRYWKYEDGAWVEKGTVTGENPAFPGTRTYWANHDIVSNEDGSVFLAASEPIPVYE